MCVESTQVISDNTNHLHTFMLKIKVMMLLVSGSSVNKQSMSSFPSRMLQSWKKLVYHRVQQPESWSTLTAFHLKASRGRLQINANSYVVVAIRVKYDKAGSALGHLWLIFVSSNFSAIFWTKITNNKWGSCTPDSPWSDSGGLRRDPSVYLRTSPAAPLHRCDSVIPPAS